MCVLYSGIYRVALNLQRKSEEKHRKMASLVMAGGEMSKVGTGLIQAPCSDAADDDDDESASRTGPLRQQPAPGSKRNRPKQLMVTSTTALLSPGPTTHKPGSQVELYTDRFIYIKYTTDDQPRVYALWYTAQQHQQLRGLQNLQEVSRDQTYDYKTVQESCAIAKMTAQCAL